MRTHLYKLSPLAMSPSLHLRLHLSRFLRFLQPMVSYTLLDPRLLFSVLLLSWLTSISTYLSLITSRHLCSCSSQSPFSIPLSIQSFCITMFTSPFPTFLLDVLEQRHSSKVPTLEDCRQVGERSIFLRFRGAFSSFFQPSFISCCRTKLRTNTTHFFCHSILRNLTATVYTKAYCSQAIRQINIITVV